MVNIEQLLFIFIQVFAINLTSHIHKNHTSLLRDKKDVFFSYPCFKKKFIKKKIGKLYKNDRKEFQQENLYE